MLYASMGQLSYILGGWSNERKDEPLERWTLQTAMVYSIMGRMLTWKGKTVMSRMEANEDEQIVIAARKSING